ncbi:MAG: hypothetical protein Q4A00_06745 [Flavobacteriaceae bacterium]|nr:hypothetical protein [Flavobacteriaceae bacterium]
MVERLEIAYSRKFIHSLDSQLNILFREKILNRIDRAEQMVEEVYNFIENNIDESIETPEKFVISGKRYLRYIVNENWVWFLFFNQEGDKVIMTHLLNNQSTEYSTL